MKLMMRHKITNALKTLTKNNEFDINENSFVLEQPRDPNHGQLATNAAMVLCKKFDQKPRELAQAIIAAIDNRENYIEKMEIAGPGFINFTFSLAWWAKSLKELLAAGSNYGRGPQNGQKVQVEYVSANPTGPLHVGHGRGAAIGDALARILAYAGFEVSREYYINDAGRQMQILGASVLARLRQLADPGLDFPDNHYRGEYIKDIANDLFPQYKNRLNEAEQTLVPELTCYAKDLIFNGIKNDLSAFRALHDVWFSETSLYENGLVPKALEFLKKNGHLYEEEGALWFRSEPLGDDKNRVLIKSNGDQTYFSADIAYHWNKFDRGFDHVIDVLGADHHGYVPRMKAAVEALGYEKTQLTVLLVQMVSLSRKGEPVAMSTRAGEFVTLKEVIDEVGADAARFIFLTRSADSPLDFDLELAASKSKDNPVYYVQYVGARIESILSSLPPLPNEADLSLLKEDEELALMIHLSAFPEMVAASAKKQEPHHVATYLTNLAKLFHHYYGIHRINADDAKITAARACLIKAIRLVVFLGLSLLGVDSPNKM